MEILGGGADSISWSICCSVCLVQAFVESLSTIKFANRAKNIKNEARVNEDVDQKSLLRKYERELKRLRSELEERSRNVVDKRRLLEVDELRRRAELDKMAAIRALEARSREFLKEKEEKRRLEERINTLQSQVLSGGETGGPVAGNLLDTPAFRNALKEHQEKIRQKYEARLLELERERESIEEEKAQVDRYKQLLLKQRDIMILLTQRLNERDDQIVALQDELDAYDRHQRELEEKLDERTAALIHLQRVAMEHNAMSPVKSSAIAEALGLWSAPGSIPSPIFSDDGDSSVGAGGSGGPSAAPGSGVPARLLLTTKQFRPFEDSVVLFPSSSAPASASASSLMSSAATGGGGGAASGGSGGAVGGGRAASPPTGLPLLSAEEKISELGGLVESFRAEVRRGGVRGIGCDGGERMTISRTDDICARGDSVVPPRLRFVLRSTARSRTFLSFSLASLPRVFPARSVGARPRGGSSGEGEPGTPAPREAGEARAVGDRGAALWLPRAGKRWGLGWRSLGRGPGGSPS